MFRSDKWLRIQRQTFLVFLMQRRDVGSVWVWPSSRGAFGRDKARWSQESGTLKPSNEWQNATGVYWVSSNNPRGSVGDVLAIIHSVLYPGDQKFQLTLFKPKINCTMIMGLGQKATSARQEWMKWQSNSRKKPDSMFCLLYNPPTQMDCSIFCFVWIFASLDMYWT